MVEIYNNLFIGNQDDYEGKVRAQPNWAVVQACKEPYHRQALGYSGRGAPQNHPEYLVAKRGNRIILNLVDVDNPDWVSPIIIDEAIRFIKSNLESGKNVLVHCNQGMSRSAGIGLLYLSTQGYFRGESFEVAENKYRTSIYPEYNPSQGIRGYIIRNWNKYSQDEFT